MHAGQRQLLPGAHQALERGGAALRVRRPVARAPRRPTSRLPSASTDTTDGVSTAPCTLGIGVGTPSFSQVMRLLVVPRSMPKINRVPPGRDARRACCRLLARRAAGRFYGEPAGPRAPRPEATSLACGSPPVVLACARGWRWSRTPCRRSSPSTPSRGRAAQPVRGPPRRHRGRGDAGHQQRVLPAGARAAPSGAGLARRSSCSR